MLLLGPFQHDSPATNENVDGTSLGSFGFATSGVIVPSRVESCLASAKGHTEYAYLSTLAS